MKKFVSAFLALLCSLSCLSTTLAVSYQETASIQTQKQKIEELELRYGVSITPHDPNSTDYLAPSVLEEVENFLIIMETISEAQQQNRTIVLFDEESTSCRTMMQADSTVTSWDFNRSNQVNEYVTLADGSRIQVRGTVYYDGYVRKTVIDGKVYLSGYVSNCYVEGIYTGTQSFLNGSLNIQGNGTTCASYCPSGTILFEVSFQMLTVSGRHTFWHPIIDLIVP